MELKNVKITRIGSKGKGSPYFLIGAKEFDRLKLSDENTYDLEIKESETTPETPQEDCIKPIEPDKHFG